MSAETRAAPQPAPPPCPTCGSSEVVPIAYGLPGAEMWDAAKEGRIRLGGCVVPSSDEWDDRWACPACG